MNEDCGSGAACVSLVKGCRCFESCAAGERGHPLDEPEGGTATRIILDEQELRETGAYKVPEVERVKDDLSEALLSVQLEQRLIRGVLKTALGGLGFSSSVQEDGPLLVTFETADRLVITMKIDHRRSKVDISHESAETITAKDHFLFQVLARSLGRALAISTPEAEALQRAANLWAEHPVGPIRTGTIEGGETDGETLPGGGG